MMKAQLLNGPKCDQIGQFLKDLVLKIYYRSSQLFGYYETQYFLIKNWKKYFIPTFLVTLMGHFQPSYFLSFQFSYHLIMVFIKMLMARSNPGPPGQKQPHC